MPTSSEDRESRPRGAPPRPAPRRPLPRMCDSAVAHDDIATRAYELFLRRGAQHGQDLDDWLAAERELQPVGRLQCVSA